MESLYVCLFSNGHIKVGRSNDVEERISQHVERVSCMGVRLMHSAEFPCASSAIGQEAALIALCAEHAPARHKNEWFEGLSLETVLRWGAECAAMSTSREVDTFGSRLRQARCAAGLTQTVLGRGMGVAGGDLNKAAVSTWELDQCSPNVIQLRLLCERLGVSADHLLGIKQPVLPPSP